MLSPIRPSRSFRTLVLTSFVVGSLSSGIAAAHSQESQAKFVTRFEEKHPVSQVVVAPTLLADKLTGRTAISLAADRFYRKSGTSLVTGYAIAGGGAISVQRGASTLPRTGNAPNATPFEESANFIDVGIRPDFLKSGDLNGDGERDLIVASRGGSSVRVLLGDGKGGFQLQAPVPVKGTIASLAVWKSNGADLIAVGLCSHSCSVDFFEKDGTRIASLPISDKPVMLQTARLNGGPDPDLLVGGASGVWVIDGTSALNANPRMDALYVASAAAVDTGTFLFDRRGMPQVAVLTTDGSLHIFARKGILSTPVVPPANIRQLIHQHKLVRPAAVKPGTLAWYEAETLHNAATLDSSVAPILLRSRVSGSGMDDLLILNAAGGNTITVRHPVVAHLTTSADVHAGTVQVLAASIERETASSTPVLAALPLRISPDARLGLVTASGRATPESNGVTVAHTYTVNTTDDGPVPDGTNPCTNGGTCTLRDAIAQANLDATTNENNGTVDSINIPGGYTYTLGNNGTPDQFGDLNYHIEIYGPVNLLTLGGLVTITTNNKDRIFSENSGNPTVVNNAQPPIDVFLSFDGLTNGVNPTPPSNTEGDVGGALMDADTGGTGNITLQGVQFSNGVNDNGYGGALSVDDARLSGGATVGNGLLTIEGADFRYNAADEGGGAVAAGYYTYDVPIDLSNGYFDHNSANATLNSTQDTNSQGIGGALFLAPTENITAESTVTDCEFVSNSAINGSYSVGGGIWAAAGATITGNLFDLNSVNGTSDSYGEPLAGLGGAVAMNADQFNPVFTGNQFQSNSATLDGGAIWLLEDTTLLTALPATVRYNSFNGDYATASGRSGLAISYYKGPDYGDANASVTATENFWGCNGPAAGTGCDTAPGNGVPGPVVSPYALLTASLNTTTPATGAIITVTGGITTDSNGNALGAGNLTGFEMLQAYISISQNGSVLMQGSDFTDSTATASLSATATTGSGSASFRIGEATITNTFTSPSGTTLNLAASPTYTHVGQQVQLTATLSPYTGSDGETITFLNFGTSIGTGTLSGGVATLNTTTLPAGYNDVTASYGGDSNLNKSSSTANDYPVLSTVQLAANPTSFSTTGNTTIKATVLTGAADATGTVSLVDNANGVQVGTCTLGTGSTCNIKLSGASLPAQTQTVQANYSGSLASSTSAPLTLVVTNHHPNASAITSPTSGSTLTGASQTFSWSAGSAVEWQLLVGNAVGTENYFHTNAQFTTTANVTGLPTNGSAVYVRLLYRVNDAWQHVDYTYTASAGVTPTPATLTTPTPATTLTGANVTFNWTAGSGSQYELYIGTTQGASNLYNSKSLYTTSASVTGLPTTGQTLYVRLWSYIANAWHFNDYTYTAYSNGTAAVLTTPTPSTALNGSSVNFAWTAGTGVGDYELYVGTTQGAGNIYQSNPLYTTSQTVSGIPTNGETLYVRLWSRIGETWQYADYTYTAQ